MGLGEASERQTQTLLFNDEEPGPQLQQLAIANPGKQIYLSGSITVDYPEGIRLQPPGRQYETAVLAGESLTLEFHPLEVAMMQLSDQWVTGSLKVMVQETTP